MSFLSKLFRRKSKDPTQGAEDRPAAKGDAAGAAKAPTRPAVPGGAPPGAKPAPGPPTQEELAGLSQGSAADLGSDLDNAFDGLLDSGQGAAAPEGAGHGSSTAADMAALHATYAELAVGYCAPVRNVMVEVTWGKPPVLWLEYVRSALGSLHAMAAQVELPDLMRALDDFTVAVSAAIVSGEVTVEPERRQALLDAYAPLCACLPEVFDLKDERDRREPIILRSLLMMVPGVSALHVERFFSAGLNRLESIVKAKPEEVAVVTRAPVALAEQILEVLREENSLGTGNAAGELERLSLYVGKLSDDHALYEQAATGWNEQSRADKRNWRQERDRQLLRIQVSLARLGQVDLIDELERLPYGRKIEELQKYLHTASPVG